MRHPAYLLVDRSAVVHGEFLKLLLPQGMFYGVKGKNDAYFILPLPFVKMSITRNLPTIISLKFVL